MFYFAVMKFFPLSFFSSKNIISIDGLFPRRVMPAQISPELTRTTSDVGEPGQFNAK